MCLSVQRPTFSTKKRAVELLRHDDFYELFFFPSLTFAYSSTILVFFFFFFLEL